MSVAEPDVARARHLLSLDRNEEAEEALSRALATDPENVTAWCLMGNLRLRQDRPRDAIACVSRASAIAPDEEWPHRIASIAYSQVNPQQAVASARQAVRLAPNLAVAHAQLAIALAHGSYREKRESPHEAEHAIALQPENADIHFMAGNASLGRRKYKEAEQHYLRALEITPDYAPALNNISVARLRRGRFLSAADGFGGAAAIDPSNDLHRRNLDAAVNRYLRMAYRALTIVAILTINNNGFGYLAIALPVVTIGLIIHARGTLNSLTWSYISRLPRRNPRIGIFLLLLAVATVTLIAAPFVSQATASNLVTPALLVLAGFTIFSWRAQPS